MTVAIIQYNAGNVHSVVYALKRLSVNAIITDKAEQIQQADKVIFPGVGEASSAMRYLKERKLNEVIINLKQPVLGICLGMQLMCAYSEENNTTCLNIFDETIKRFQPSPHSEEWKVPQVGWNSIFQLKTNLFQNVAENSYCYFVHSYYAALGPHTIATTHYIQPYSAALHKNNFYGVQFHPEKSATVGEQILQNFLNL
jgi:glutamine amidotransferase